MSATYQEIRKSEFEEKVSELIPIEEVYVANTSEIVYEAPLPDDDLSVRIFSSIDGSKTRGKGQDAIRLVLWSEEVDGPVSGRKKTLRIGPTESNPEGWWGNLKDKIIDLYGNWHDEQFGDCPECGNILVQRSGKYGEFVGCSNYPECRHTQDL